ncbi:MULTISPECIES: TolC family outer membrane protein [Methylobacterium]|uniref:Outer membrane efflux protein BepC n=1 Tax=Methylobacterium bullatum TaxID=570505 RepID=A0A679K8T2_9HYPH|nr:MULTISPECIES: TolC family outer membrane protein [Methylobacterium]KQO53418.1 channel protein TolC [Methylobacterium sp. Leaf85]MBD8903311.1 channel protein TolC [Methylobacterium bullatum]GJD41176.1 Outer membrane efflux protein BepC [Methylobacterium bullatum]CAA2144360.1 Outer membrane efflux protein BepC [Methylobacterium bullatum]
MDVRQRKLAKSFRLRLGGFAALTLAAASPAVAETLDSALARAYGANPALNASRAGLRATDENVAQAKAGYRPTVSLDADIGLTQSQGRVSGISLNQVTKPGGAGLTINQTLFNGFQTDNQTRRAESDVLGTRESLRSTEMTTLFNAAQIYMSVLSDTATLELRRNNVEVLEEQLRQTRDRFNVGEVTRTDVAQAEARLAGARSDVSGAEANLRASIGTYRRIIGVEPRQLAPGRPLDRFVPPNLDSAISIGLKEHPQILSSMHAVDVAEAQVKIFEGALAPSAALQGSVQQRYDTQFPGDNGVTASIVGRISVPLYEGGQTYSQIRQAKELVGQARINVEDIRDQVRSAIVTAWGRLEAAKAQVIASQAQVQANEVALNGVREEARVGQRTTLDVLNAQQELLNSRVNLILAQRDRVVNSYGVVQTVGRLTVRFTSIPVVAYSPKEHFDQVKDLWYGVRTPDGR